jgi:hypothetical protein
VGEATADPDLWDFCGDADWSWADAALGHPARSHWVLLRSLGEFLPIRANDPGVGDATQGGQSLWVGMATGSGAIAFASSSGEVGVGATGRADGLAALPGSFLNGVLLGWGGLRHASMHEWR